MAVRWRFCRSIHNQVITRCIYYMLWNTTHVTYMKEYLKSINYIVMYYCNCVDKTWTGDLVWLKNPLTAPGYEKHACCISWQRIGPGWHKIPYSEFRMDLAYHFRHALIPLVFFCGGAIRLVSFPRISCRQWHITARVFDLIIRNNLEWTSSLLYQYVFASLGLRR